MQPETGLQAPPGTTDIAVIGGGPAGLMAAEVAAAAGCRVVVLDRMPSLARKFLMAGRGGLNLTHSEELERFLDRYGTARDWLEPMVRAFPPAALVAWVEGLGQPTFVGSSGRVFPQALKASPLLRAWGARLEALGVTVRPRFRGLVTLRRHGDSAFCSALTYCQEMHYLIFVPDFDAADLAPDRRMLLTTKTGLPDLSAMSRSCSSITLRAGASPSRPPRISLGTLRLDRREPFS